MEPIWWEDVCAALALEEKSEPKRERGATRRKQCFSWSLDVIVS